MSEVEATKEAVVAVPGYVEEPERLRTEEGMLETVDGAQMPVYIARPTEKGRFPGLVLVHEAYGPVEHMRDLARRFANEGYVAIVPDLYHRLGAPDKSNIKDVLRVMFMLRDQDAVSDLAVAAAHLRSDEESSGKVGVIGFCSGGRQALLFACSQSPPDAVVDCWGGFIRRANFKDEATTEARPARPIDLVPQLGCPLYAVSGVEDDNPSLADMDELEARLAEARKDATVERFQGAGHAFLADYREHYREGPAFELWAKLTAFFTRTLSERT